MSGRVLSKSKTGDQSERAGHPKREAPSTVGRGRAVTLRKMPDIKLWRDEFVTLCFGDSLEYYEQWPAPTVVISDGGYGVLGFEGDTSGHLGLPEWYEPHVKAWAHAATPSTTLWFWNSEIGWAAVHPVLEKHGWRYVNCNIWNKGKAHIAGNVNTTKIRRFPVVTEVCVQYVLEARIQGLPLKQWLLGEWKRSGLPLRDANRACGVADAAVRKYFDQGHLWYYPPPDMFVKLQRYANQHGRPEGRPYFAIDGKHAGTAEQWASFRAKFRCPHGVTNVWDRNPLSGKERIRINGDNGRAVHLNQKPIDLMTMLIEASSDPGDVVWEPFGGLFTGALAAGRLKRRAFAAEIDPTYFQYGIARLREEGRQHPLF
jgi:DNA methylase